MKYRVRIDEFDDHDMWQGSSDLPLELEQQDFLDRIVSDWSVPGPPPSLAEAAAWCLEELNRREQKED